MSDAVVQELVLDLLEWVAKRDRSYQDAMDAWRTSCPKLPVWEDATDQGFIVIESVERRNVVRITSAGRIFLEQHRPQISQNPAITCKK